MRVASLGVARPAYYDRNATSTLQTYDATVGQHSQTTRWTTTVASGSKMLVEHSFGRLTTLTAATTKNIFDYLVVYITSGATTITLYDLILESNTIGVSVRQIVTQGPTIYGGEVIYGATAIGSTGSNLQILMQFKGTTFTS